MASQPKCICIFYYAFSYFLNNKNQNITTTAVVKEEKKFICVCFQLHTIQYFYVAGVVNAYDYVAFLNNNVGCFLVCAPLKIVKSVQKHDD